MKLAFTYDGQMGPYILFPGIAVAGYVYGALFLAIYLRRSRASTVAAFLVNDLIVPWSSKPLVSLLFLAWVVT